MKEDKTDILKDQWERSYRRKENFLFYPKEQTVKFLNRFVRKKIAIDKFEDIIDFSKKIRGLDYGCGIGRSAILMKEFGIDAYGMDISEVAIEKAKKMASILGYENMVNNFIITSGKEIPFENNFFDITISESVLDSMNFELSKKIIKEFDRTTKLLVYISLISGDDGRHNGEFNGEEIVKTEHEQGTVQSYYDLNKIQTLIKDTNFAIDWCQLVTEESLTEKNKYRRYHLVLRKKNNPVSI